MARIVARYEFVCQQKNCAWQTEDRYYWFIGAYTEAKQRGWTWAWRHNGYRYWRDDYCPKCTEEWLNSKIVEVKMTEEGNIKLARDLKPGDWIRVGGRAAVVESVDAIPGDLPSVRVQHTHGREEYIHNAKVLIIRPSPLADARLWEYLDKSEDVRNLYLEMMAAAYLSMTDVPPDRVSLVQDVRHDEEEGVFRTVWYFKEQEEGVDHP